MGAASRGGRWNPPGLPVVYASLTYEGALLEQLVRNAGGMIPVGRVASRIFVPRDCRVRVLDEAEHPDWRDGIASREIGQAWVASRETVALQIPSYVSQPWGRNVMLNLHHPDFSRVQVAEVVDIRWDSRLF